MENTLAGIRSHGFILGQRYNIPIFFTHAEIQVTVKHWFRTPEPVVLL